MKDKINSHVDSHSRKSKGCVREWEREREREGEIERAGERERGKRGGIKCLFSWYADWFITRWFVLKIYFSGHPAPLSAVRLVGGTCGVDRKVQVLHECYFWSCLSSWGVILFLTPLQHQYILCLIYKYETGGLDGYLEWLAQLTQLTQLKYPCFGVNFQLFPGY